MDDITKKRLEEYFDYYAPCIDTELVCELLTVDNVFSYACYLLETKYSLMSSIYYKLFAQLIRAEQESEKYKKEIAQLCYVIGYYVGLFLHPINSRDISLHYLNRALNLAETDEFKKEIFNIIDVVQKTWSL